jgi:hypothetical protein
MAVRLTMLYMATLSSEILGSSGAVSNQLCTEWTHFSVPREEKA